MHWGPVFLIGWVNRSVVWPYPPLELSANRYQPSGEPLHKETHLHYKRIWPCTLQNISKWLHVFTSAYSVWSLLGLCFSSPWRILCPWPFCQRKAWIGIGLTWWLKYHPHRASPSKSQYSFTEKKRKGNRWMDGWVDRWKMQMDG